MESWHSRGYLPHFEAGETPQFITFRLADSLPIHVLTAWQQDLQGLPDGERKSTLARRVQGYLDAGCGEAFLARPAIARIVEDALLLADGRRFHLHAWVVMPNHVHVIATPAADVTLAQMLQG